MKETKRLFRWFWAWNDEQEEAWLKEQARDGWHLVTPGVFGRYTFERGVPRNDVYRLDYKTTGKDMEEYLQLFSDAGWEHLGYMGGWQYFRTTAEEGEDPEIYTDNASKVQKYQRLLLFLVIFLPIYITSLNNVSGAEFAFAQVISALLALALLLYSYAIVRIMLRIRQLKR